MIWGKHTWSITDPDAIASSVNSLLELGVCRLSSCSRRGRSMVWVGGLDSGRPKSGNMLREKAKAKCKPYLESFTNLYHIPNASRG